MKIFKNMKIATRIIAATFLLVLIAVVCTAFASVRNFSTAMMGDAEKLTKQSLLGFHELLSEQMVSVRNFRDLLISNEGIAKAMKDQDREAVFREAESLMKASGLDILTFMAPDGTVIARTHNREKFGDNVGNSADFREAISGRNYEWLMEAPSTKLGYYCGAPVRYRGEIVGALRVAISLTENQVVDRIKTLYGVEATVFAGPTRVNTTIVNEGKRVLGTDASPAVVQEVLRGGKNFSSQISLFERPYIVEYMPFRDGSGGIKGMLFTGTSLESIYPAIRNAIAHVALLAGVVILVAFAIAFSLARMIAGPLARIVSVAERGEGGDLRIARADFGYNGGGELKTLVDALYGMISAQVNALAKVIGTADSVEDHSTQLGTLAEENNAAMRSTENLIREVSELCRENSDAVDRGNSGMSEMATGINAVAQMSTESADALAKTTTLSHDAVDAVKKLVAGIGDVDAKTLENQTKIRELSNSVDEISNFMSVIASIADQTNLLALNAAIEAARAGEAGRGFAVVAEEVRKLAEESRNASKSVDELVGALSGGAGDAISATEASVRIVHEITKMADEALDGLSAAMAEIANANDSVQSIAAVAEEQAASSTEISEAIDDINQSTQRITEKMNDLHRLSTQATEIGHTVSAAANDMLQSAGNLKDDLAHFKM